MRHLLSAAVVLIACSSQRPIDYAGYRLRVLAHELGHAGGLEHWMPVPRRGHIWPVVGRHDAALRVRSVDCLGWDVPLDLELEFDVSSEDWCFVSGGEFCPWAQPDARCRIAWASMEHSTLGDWRPGRIRINTTLMG